MSNLSAAQIEALAKVRESEVKAREDMVEFMKEVEDRERGDGYRRQELDAKFMDAAKPVSARCKCEEVSTLRVYGADAGEFLRGVRGEVVKRGDNTQIERNKMGVFEKS